MVAVIQNEAHPKRRRHLPPSWRRGKTNCHTIDISCLRTHQCSVLVSMCLTGNDSSTKKKFVVNMKTVGKMMRFVLFSLWISNLNSLVEAVDLTTCKGLVYNNKLCYEFVTGQMTWTEAAQACSVRNGTLPSLTGKALHDIIAVFVEKQLHSAVWLDGKETFLDNYDWHWLKDGSILSYQGCIPEKVNPPYDLKNNVSISAVTPDACKAACKNINNKYAGVWYSSVKTEALCYCDNEYGTGEGYATCGVGIACNADPEPPKCGSWDKSFIFYVDGTYNNWGFQQPDNKNDPETCGSVGSEADERTLQDEPCLTKKYYICGTSLTEDQCTGTNYEYVGGECLYISDTKENWFVARQQCEIRGAILLKIPTSLFMDNLKTVLNQKNSEQYWIGLVRSEWKKKDGGAILFTEFGIIDNAFKTENCLALTNSSGFKWDDVACKENISVLCQYGADDTGTTLPGPDAGASTDDNSGWSTFEILVVVGLVLLAIIIAIAVVSIIYYKKQSSPNRVSPEPDEKTEKPDINADNGSETAGIVMTDPFIFDKYESGQTPPPKDQSGNGLNHRQMNGEVRKPAGLDAPST